MATTVRILAEDTGLGEDHRLAALFTQATATTNQVLGPAYIVPTVTTQVNAEVGSIPASGLRGILIRAAAGSLYVTPASSATISTVGIITQEAFVYYNYNANLSCVPAVCAFASTAAYEVWAFGVATA